MLEIARASMPKSGSMAETGLLLMVNTTNVMGAMLNNARIGEDIRATLMICLGTLNAIVQDGLCNIQLSAQYAYSSETAQ